MYLNVCRAFHINCLILFIATLRGQQFQPHSSLKNIRRLYIGQGMYFMFRHPTVSACYHSSCSQEVAVKNKEIFINDLSNYSLFIYLSLLGATSISTLFSSNRQSCAAFCEHFKTTCKCHFKTTCKHEQIGHPAKDEGSHEVGGSNSVRSELTHKPVDKWRV